MIGIKIGTSDVLLMMLNGDTLECL